MADQAIGMMDAAYFVGKREVLGFINDTLKLAVNKIEETATGAVACGLLDAMYPGKVPMKKVNWGAKHEHEYVKNYAVLQAAFTKLKIDRHVDVQKLVRAKFQDNLEFMQWFKRYFELTVGDGTEGYDPVAARAAGKNAPGALSGGTKARTGAASTTRSAPVRRNPVKRRVPDSKTEAASENKPKAANHRVAKAAPVAPSKREEELRREAAELKVTMEGLERERDFYFGKLRDIEILLQTEEPQDEAEQTPLVKRIYKILYATEEDFEAEPEATTTTEEPSAMEHTSTPAVAVDA